MTTSESLPTDLAAAHAIILAERAAPSSGSRRGERQSGRLPTAKAAEALISYLKLEIEKVRRQIYGSRSECKARFLEQMELQLEELEATEDEAAERAAAQAQTVRTFQRKRPVAQTVSRPFAARACVVAAPENCPCCAHRSYQSWAKILPRRWRSFPGSGR